MRETRAPLSIERLRAFTDGVVAIAITLLILPLMDSVGAAGAAHQLTWEWLTSERDSIAVFALSFALIASFWVGHHRLFARIHALTTGLMWITIAWMFTIVWLPVATAVLSAMPPDTAQKCVYIGSLMLASMVGFVSELYVMRHPQLHSIDAGHLRDSLAAGIATLLLFAVALAVAILFPVISYWALLVLVLTRIVSRVMRPLVRIRPAD